MKKLLNLFKHKHKWENFLTYSLYYEGWEYYYKCKCGAIKKKYIGKKEELKEEGNKNE